MLRHYFNKKQLGPGSKFSLRKNSYNSTHLVSNIYMLERNGGEICEKMVFLIIKDCIFGDN